MKKTTHTPDGKIIEDTVHEDGRKDVKIHVPLLDVNGKDPATAKAKKHIEGKVFKKLAKQKVLVVVIHKPTNTHAEVITTVDRVRHYAEDLVAAYNRSLSKKHGQAGLEAPKEEFVVVEHHLTNNGVKLTTL